MTAQLFETGVERADTARRVITKADWLAAQMCPAMGWFRLRTASEPPSEADRFRMEQGQEIGRLARKLYPEGVLVSAKAGRRAVDITQDLIGEAATATLFEAEFRTGSFVARADILRRHDSGWHLKSNRASLTPIRSTNSLKILPIP